MLVEKACFTVVFMCRQLAVSRSGFYGWCARGESLRAAMDRALTPLIHAEFLEHPRGCGSRPIVQALREQGHGVSRKRAVRLMAQAGLRHRLKRRFARTTDSRHKNRVAKNVLARNFEVGLPNRTWAGDITYIHTKRGWAYLAAILDVGSRKVVGWAVSNNLDQELALEALRRAIAARRPPRGLIHHSDRGVQYTADHYRALLAEHGLIASMSRKGNCWDNAVAESFFSSLKRELPNDHVFEDAKHVERSVFAYVEAYYNSRRRHSALGQVSPNEYERLQVG